MRHKEGQNAPAKDRRADFPREEVDPSASKPESVDTATKLNAILAAINKLDVKVDTLALDLNLLRTDQKKVVERVTRVETEVTAFHPQMKDLCGQMAELTKRIHFSGIPCRICRGQGVMQQPTNYRPPGENGQARPSVLP